MPAPIASLGANCAEFELVVGEHRSPELGVLSFDAREELSRPYLAEVVFVAEPDLDVEALEGEKALLTVVNADGAVRYFDGVAEGVERLGPSRDPEKHRYRLRLRPRLWLLSERRRSRIYQGMTAVEVVTAVLKEWGIAHRLALSGRYAARE